MLITVNRNIWRALSEELQKIYITDCITSEEDSEILPLPEVTKAIYAVVKSNENAIDKVGLKKYYDNDMPASLVESGFRHIIGNYYLIPFDWSMESAEDEDWTYSFQVAETL
jgi:hypothetical protein